MLTDALDIVAQVAEPEPTQLIKCAPGFFRESSDKVTASKAGTVAHRP